MKGSKHAYDMGDCGAHCKMERFSGSEGCCNGRKIVITVPDGSVSRLRKWIRPPFFSSRSLVIHRPSPVPTSCLEVKNRVKSLRLSSHERPGPLSPTLIMTPLPP